MSTANPNAFTTSDVIAAQALLINNSIGGQLDLRGAIGAYVQYAVAKISATAYTNPVDIVVSRLFGTIAGSAPFSGNRRSIVNALGRSSSSGTGSGAGAVTTQLNALTNVGDTSLVIKTANTGLSAYGSLMAILGATAPGSLTNAAAVANFELARMDSTSGAGPWTLQLGGGMKLGIAHAANDYVTSNPECWEVWFPGGFVYDVLFDCNNIAAGAGAVVRCVAQVYPSDNIA